MFTLLHIDNNFFYKEILKNISDEREVRYFSAKTPEKAYDIIKSHDIDIIVTGLEFDFESREEFIIKLMSIKHKTTPVVVFTAEEELQVKKRMYELGITKYLTKDRFMNYLSEYIQQLQSEDQLHKQLKSLKIAILDDNETHMGIIRELLSNNESSFVDTYTHPFDLLESKKHYNIYLIDLVLPDITGGEVISRLRSMDEYAVIIAVSSLESPNVISKILASGADDYIVKPITPNLFLARIKANVRTYNCMEKLKGKNEQLSHLVKVDGLTGLYNHNAILDLLEKEVERADRYSEPLSVIMFDIDRFKSVNDNYGHHVGDEVLKQVSHVLKRVSRDFDIIGRYGGEEFIVILPETKLNGAVIYADRFRQEVQNMTFSESELRITVSGGVATHSGESKMDLLRNADHVLYLAKENGRNRIEIFQTPTSGFK